LGNAGQQHIVLFRFFQINWCKAHMGENAAHVVKVRGIVLAPKPEKRSAVQTLQAYRLLTVMLQGRKPCVGQGRQQRLCIGQRAYAHSRNLKRQGHQCRVQSAPANPARQLGRGLAHIAHRVASENIKLFHEA